MFGNRCRRNQKMLKKKKVKRRKVKEIFPSLPHFLKGGGWKFAAGTNRLRVVCCGFARRFDFSLPVQTVGFSLTNLWSSPNFVSLSPSLFYLYFKARVKIKVFIDFLEFFFINKNLLNSHFTFRNKRQNLNKKNFLILISSFSIKIIIKWRVKIYFYYISLNQMWEANEGEIKDGDWKRSTKLWFFFFYFFVFNVSSR